MNLVEIFCVALALSVDAFVCSVVGGSLCRDFQARTRLALSYGLTFGLFQFWMPVIGFLGGTTLLHYIDSFDHWLSFLLLAAVSISMIHDAFSSDKEPLPRGGLWWLLCLGIATSIDALAVGLSLTALDDRVILISTVIGVVCFMVSATGGFLGAFLARFKAYSRFMNLAGATVLLYIGIQVLIEHGALSI